MLNSKLSLEIDDYCFEQCKTSNKCKTCNVKKLQDYIDNQHKSSKKTKQTSKPVEKTEIKTLFIDDKSVSSMKTLMIKPVESVLIRVPVVK